MLLPEVLKMREMLEEHNQRIYEKTDTYIKAFVHYNFSKERHIDETPYFKLQREIEHVDRSATILNAVAAARDRAEKKGEIGLALTMRKEEQANFLIVRSGLEAILAEVAKTELKIDRDVLARLAADFRSAGHTYAIEIGLVEGKEGATDKLDNEQRIREE